MPICVPLPVVTGRPRFFFVAPLIALPMETGYHEKQAGGKCSASAPALTQATGGSQWLKLIQIIPPSGGSQYLDEYAFMEHRWFLLVGRSGLIRGGPNEVRNDRNFCRRSNRFGACRVCARRIK
jgi:hypothetical protein